MGACSVPAAPPECACPPGTACFEGRCACPGGTSECGGACVDVRSDALHCGGCDHRCAPGAVCIEGACGCADRSMTYCDGRCVSLSSDPSHCGRCTTACPRDAACVDGLCVCPETTGALPEMCNGRCVDLATDPDHCGSCTVECPLGCHAGVCSLVAEIDVGEDHACLRIDDGTIRCWGANVYGELGIGDSPATHRPALVPLPGAASDLAVGGRHTCALVGGVPYCWGRGDDGELGVGAAGVRARSPVPVEIIDDAIAIAAGYEATCALRADRSVWCWGAADQLREGETGIIPSPELWDAGPCRDVVLGPGHTCARALDGSVRCVARTAGERISTSELAGADELAAGETFVCARLGGEVLCAGSNEWGELGDGTPWSEWTASPTTALLRERALEVEGLDAATCALGESRRVFCWGSNALSNILLDPAIDAIPTPLRVPGIEGDSLACAHDECCVLRGGVEVECWGGEATTSEVVTW